jgi:GTP-binding protein
LKITTAEFLISNTNPGKCPDGTLPEFAFIGRSNVGKSSLINMLVERKGLAKTSGKPGKTQTINHFIINSSWYLVDLPGYGYASVSRTQRANWGSMIETYLLKRENLACTFVLIDSRLEPQKIDVEFIQWMGEHQLPLALVFTKIDKLKMNEWQKNRARWKKKLQESWAELPVWFETSAEERKGRDALLEFMEQAMTRSGE